MTYDDIDNGRRVLVAEDDAFLRQVYVDKLRLAGYDTISAGRPEDCLRAVYRSAPDVVVLDLDLVATREDLVGLLVAHDRNLPILLNAAGSDRLRDPEVGPCGPFVFRVGALPQMLRLIRWLTSDDSPARRRRLPARQPAYPAAAWTHAGF